MLIFTELNYAIWRESSITPIDTTGVIEHRMTANSRMVNTNSAPTFTTGLTAVIVQEWSSSIYSFPSVIDSENDPYTISIPSLENGDNVPTWII